MNTPVCISFADKCHSPACISSSSSLRLGEKKTPRKHIHIEVPLLIMQNHAEKTIRGYKVQQNKMLCLTLHRIVDFSRFLSFAVER